MSDEPGESRRGRRAGNPDTRGEILAAARRLFSEQGFTTTSLRAVAREAGVDAALVHHYFRDKTSLLLAALQVPGDPVALMQQVAHSGLEGLGPRLVATALKAYDSPLGAAAREAISTEPELAFDIVGVLVGRLETAAATMLPDLSPQERRERLARMQVIMAGLAASRLIVGRGPAAELSERRVVEIFGPMVQAALDGRPTSP